MTTDTTAPLLTVEEVTDLFDSVVASTYKMAPDYSLQRLSDKLRALPGLTDADLDDIGPGAVYDSAFWNGYRGNHWDAHCYCDAIMRECERRSLTEHSEGCLAVGNRYQRIWNASVRSAGHAHMAKAMQQCTCHEPETPES